MIKALVVDDEKLIRKGMISVIPWEEYGIRVTGDVNSGEKALGFLQENEVDLVITDLVMPGLSGIDLMRSIKTDFPEIRIVVLTSYKDFEYVQEALRLGAIDYIIKSEIEKEKMGDILERILERMGLEKQHRGIVKTNNARVFTGGLLLMVPYPEGVKGIEKIHDLLKYREVYGIDACTWFIPGLENADTGFDLDLFRSISDEQFICVQIEGLGRCDWNSVLRFIENIRKRYIFYEYQRGKQFYKVDKSLFLDSEWEDRNVITQQLRSIWESFDWINSDESFQHLMDETVKANLDISVLSALAYASAKEWERFISCLDNKMDLTPQKSFLYWEDVVSWLIATRTAVRKRMQKPMYSEEITLSILKAVELVRKSEEIYMTQEAVSCLVGMSRSYFSRCFRNITEKSFNDFMMEMKIKKAEILLETTDYPVYWISEKVGYQNDKHFRRVFRKNTGMLPSEYRIAKDAGKQPL